MELLIEIFYGICAAIGFFILAVIILAGLLFPIFAIFIDEIIKELGK